MIATNAGNNTTVYTKAIITPKAPVIPKWAMGAIAAVEKDSNPAAVVKLVMKTARPECPIA